MAIRVLRHSNVSKQATLFGGLDVNPLKLRVCGCGLNRFVHEGMNHISNVEVHLKTRSGNVNIRRCENSIRTFPLPTSGLDKYKRRQVTSLIFFSNIIMSPMSHLSIFNNLLEPFLKMKMRYLTLKAPRKKCI